MSEIDSSAHEICGTIAGVPLYRVTEESPNALAKPSEVLLGGGSGEHNEAVIDVVGAALLFMLTDEFYQEDAGDSASRLPDFPTSRVSALVEALEPLEIDRVVTSRWNWSGNEFAHFVKRAKRGEGWGRPYKKKRDGSIENWVVSSIGEYVVVSRTDLLVELVTGRVSAEVIEEIRAFALAAAKRPVYMNVMAFPSGYEFVAGRRDAMGDGNVFH